MVRTEPKLLSTASEVVAAAEVLREETVIGVDTEFIRETSFFPRIALIQVANASQTWLFDPTVLSKEDLKPLLDIFTSPQILKTFHASHADQECLFWSYGVLAAPVLDTSVAAGLCGMGDSIGLQKLLREMLGVHVPKGRARAKWLARPLSSDLLHYAVEDVIHLVKLAEKLRKKLTATGRWDWALEESVVDSKVFDISPDEMAHKISKGAHLEREQPILAELIHWREKRARDANLPRGWIADNEILISIARVQPKSIDELKTFRGLHAKEIDRSGALILEAIERGKLLMADRKPEPRVELPRVDSHAADLIQTYISFLASELQIMPRYLMNAHQATQILYHLEKSKEEWIGLEILSPQAAKLIGDDLTALFSGTRALRIKNNKLALIDLDSPQ